MTAHHVTVKMALPVKRVVFLFILLADYGPVGHCQSLKLSSSEDNTSHFTANRNKLFGSVGSKGSRPEFWKPNPAAAAVFEMHLQKTDHSTNLSWKRSIAQSNLDSHSTRERILGEFPLAGSGRWSGKLKDSPPMKFKPGDTAASFKLPTLRGDIVYPGKHLTANTPVLLHAYTPDSGFLDCLWNCIDSVEDLILNSPANTHYVFMSHSQSAYTDALWMKARFQNSADNLSRKQHRPETQRRIADFLDRLHFVTMPIHELGNWIPGLLQLWICQDHNCGLDQAVLQSPQINNSLHHPLILKRLDARYDWLPSPPSVLNTTSVPALYVNDGCDVTAEVKGHVAIVTDMGCSYFQKVSQMERSGAVAVLVLAEDSSVLQDMNCNDTECTTPLNIPATMVPYNSLLTSSTNLTVRFQTTPTSNFFFGIDQQGALAEVGWFLYPTFHFLAWQAQWFNYAASLAANLSRPALAISVFNHTAMHGESGAVANITLPPLKELAQYSRFELDLALSCPGDRDTDCPHWDHTLQLYTCCYHDNASANPLCGMQLGRWITPFRRRIGRWLTDVTPLLPLLDGQHCTLTLKTSPWAMTWLPSLSLRFTDLREESTSAMTDMVADLYPYRVQPLYQPSFIFNHSYNSHFVPVQFERPVQAKKVQLVSVITGHGSDENGCGEFCVTSHHFVINGFLHERTFDTAGSPLGCASNVPEGVEPNEHGTWLYGRGGWCDGQDVKPWVMDITSQLNPSGYNDVSYYGWFNGTDPDPKQNPGIMIFSSYLVYYKELDTS